MKKMLTPIIIVILAMIGITAWAGFYLFIFDQARFPDIFKIIIILGLLGICGALIKVLNQRIKELKEEDKDDLSKY